MDYRDYGPETPGYAGIDTYGHPIHEPVETIDLAPEWPAVAEWTARALADHAFEEGSREPVVSLIEMVRYLTLTAPEEVERLIERLR